MQEAKQGFKELIVQYSLLLGFGSKAGTLQGNFAFGR